MNKKLLTICLVLVLTLSIISCAACKDNSADRLRQINAALLHEYSKIELNIVTDNDGIKLGAYYVMTTSNGITDISYEVDRLNSFDAEGAIPSEFITRVKGNATFNGNAITSIDGDTAEYDVPLNFVSSKMTFRLSFFNDLKVTPKGITANVINPQGFWNDNEFAGTDMTVSVVLNESDLSHITIGYKLDGATVQMEYAFTR